MTTPPDVAVRAAPTASPARRAAVRNPKVLLGAALLTVFALMAVLEPLLNATVWAGQRNLYDTGIGYDTAVTHPSAPSVTHWLGTNSLGRDVFALLLEATGPTFLVALSAAISIAVISISLASVAAFRRGWVDEVVSHLSDAIVLLPAMLAVFVLGAWRSNEEFGGLQVGLSFGFLYGLGPATATVRAAGLQVAALPFLDAARVAGGSGLWIVTRHMLPYLYPAAAVQAMVGATGAIIAAAFLSFRNAVGDDVGFGMMVYDGITWANLMSGIAATPWWVMLAGAGGISLLAAAFYLLGVGFRETLDPREDLV